MSRPLSRRQVDAKAVYGPGYDPLKVVEDCLKRLEEDSEAAFVHQDLSWISHHVNKPASAALRRDWLGPNMRWTFSKEEARAQKLSNERPAA